MTKAVDDPTTTDIDDSQTSIEGIYIGPKSAHWTWSKDISSLSDEEKERP